MKQQKQIKHKNTIRDVKKYKTKVSFWASYCALEFEDKRLEYLHNALLRVEDELGRIRTKLLEEFTKHSIEKRKTEKYKNSKELKRRYKNGKLQRKCV